MTISDNMGQALNLIFKNHPVPMWIYDLETLSFLEVNNAAVKKYGYSRTEFLSMTIKDIRPKEDVTKLLKDVSKKRPALQSSGTWRHLLKNGKIIFVDITSHKINFKGRNAALVIAKDVTKEIQINEELNKLNQLYTILSEVNQTIVRVSEKEKLLKRVCRIVKDIGDMICWISLIDNSKINLVSCDIVTCEGLSKKFINEQKKLFDDKSFKQIINKIIRSKRPLVFNNVKKEFNYWKTYLKYGINSFALFPLIISQKLVGIIALLSPLSSYFGEKEIKLFKEMAGDISFSLEFIEKEKERKRVEELIQLSEKFYRTLFEASPVGIILEDINGNIIDANRKFCKIVGYSKEELLKMNVRQFQRENNVHLVEENINKLLLGEFLESEITSIRKDGNIVWVQLTETRITLPNGQTGILSIAEDITEKKKAENLLRESEERFRSIYENSTIGLYRTTPDGKILLANNTLVKMLGYDSFDELKKRNLEEEGFEPTYERKIFIDKIEKEGEVLGLESAWIRKDGKVIYVRESARAVKDSNGKTLYYDGTVEDVTERKLMEEKLRVLYRSIEKSPVAVIITDKSGIIEYVNDKFCELTSYLEEEILGQELSDFITDDTEEDAKHISRFTFLKIKQEWKGELLFQKKNEELFWGSVYISPLFNERKKITNYVALIEDITEKKIILKELIEAKEAAEKSNKLKDAFIANISHEIRTPLNGILGMISLIRDSFQKYITSEEEQYFASIDNSSRRIIRTVDMILNYSRLYARDYPLEQKEIELSSICNNLVLEFQTAAKVKSLKLSFESSIGEVFINADEYSVTQIISNLIDNAIKYTKEGFVKVTLNKNSDNEAVVKVSDSGIGISKDFLKNIFEPYVQEEMGYSRAYDGIGLGLALVKKFSDMNNARVHIESVKGKGTTVIVNFGKVLHN